MSIFDYPSREEWIEHQNSISAKRLAKNAVNKFDEFLESINYSGDILKEMRGANEMELYQVIQRYVKWMEKSKTSNTVKNYTSFLRSWLRVNGIKIASEDFKYHVKFAKPLSEKKWTPTTRDLFSAVSMAKRHWRIYFSVLAVSGARQGEIFQMRVKDVDFDADPVSIHLPASNTKTKQERWTFLTPEVAQELKSFIKEKNLNPDAIVFPYTTSTMNRVWGVIRHKMGWVDKFEESGVSKYSVHRIRAHVKQVLSRSGGDDLAHMILGHSEGLATYDDATVEELGTDYSKAIPDLALNPHAKLKAREKKDQERDLEMAKMREEIRRLQAKIR